MSVNQKIKDYVDLDWSGRLANVAPVEYLLHEIGEATAERVLREIVQVFKENSLSLEQADAMLAVTKGCLHRKTKV